MGNSNFRVKECLTIHHIMNRIAHQVFFLKEEERNDFVAMMKRSAEFSGIQLIAWCIMTNHFHLLAFLPERIEVDEAEVVRRVGVLKGEAGAKALQAQLVKLRTCDEAKDEHEEGNSADREKDAEEILSDREKDAKEIPANREKGTNELPACEKKVKEVLDRYRRRMYDVGEFMKTLTQWFTEEYNRRFSHTGTLWEAAYLDRLVPLKREPLERVVAYIGLNPFRAGVCTDFDAYLWSSLHDATNGDELAIRGLRRVYGDEMEVSNMIDALHARMEASLDAEKRRWAVEVARRRKAGYDVPANPLTDEAYVAQAAAHLDEVVRAGTELHEQDALFQRRFAQRQELEGQIVAEIRLQPAVSTVELARKLKKPVPTVYAHLRGLCGRGALKRERRGAPWVVDESRIIEIGLT